MSVNQASICGRLGQAPRIRNLNNGNRVANFSVAVDQGYTNRETRQYVSQQPIWVNVSTFDENTINMLEKNAQAGRKVHVSGKLEHYEATNKEGVKVARSQILVSPYGGSITFVAADKDRYKKGSQPANEAQQAHTVNSEEFLDDNNTSPF